LFFAIFGNLIRWSYGYQLLRKRDDDDCIIADEEEITVPITSTYHSFDNNHNNASTSTSTSSAAASDSEDSDYLAPAKRDGMPSRQLSAVTITVVDESSSLLPQTHKLDNNKQLKTINNNPTPDDNIFKIILKRINGFMSPPLYAAFLALLVGLTPLKPLMYDKQSFLYPSFT
jgi:predicted permease